MAAACSVAPPEEREKALVACSSDQREVDPEFGKAITDGRGLLDDTERQLDEFLFGDLRR